jgi:S-DNA-T family DNA segregation ATPase FtsK/SpoIIIE
MRILLTAMTDRGPRDVMLTCAPETTAADVTRGILATLSDGPGRGAGSAVAPVLWLDGSPLPPDKPVATLLHDGVLVTTEARLAAATVLAEPRGTAEIRVVGGPCAGGVHRVGIGTTTIGSTADIAIDDPSLPAFGLSVTVESRRVTVAATAHGTATPRLDGEPLPTEPMEWPIGGTVTLGSSVFTLAAPSPPEDRAGQPREIPRVGPARIERPAPPARSWWRRLTRAAAERNHRAAMEAFHESIVRACRAEEAALRAAAPDPAEVLLMATGPRRGLWERRRPVGEPDEADPWLRLRTGLADHPAAIECGPNGTADEPPVVRDVPVALPLRSLGVLGLSGGRDHARGLARWLVAQAAVLHDPEDLAVVVLCLDEDAAAHWNWVRWLPHAAPRGGEDCTALVGADSPSVARRVTELAIRITERRRKPTAPHRDAVLVLDGARTLRRIPGMSQVLSGGPAAGVHVICIDDDERLLPDECATVAVWDWERTAYLRLRDASQPESQGPGTHPDRVLADQVSPQWCDRMARALAAAGSRSTAVAADTAASGAEMDVSLMPWEALGRPLGDHIKLGPGQP